VAVAVAVLLVVVQAKVVVVEEEVYTPLNTVQVEELIISQVEQVTQVRILP
jgi:hypothetical protein